MSLIRILAFCLRLFECIIHTSKCTEFCVYLVKMLISSSASVSPSPAGFSAACNELGLYGILLTRRVFIRRWTYRRPAGHTAKNARSTSHIKWPSTRRAKTLCTPRVSPENWLRRWTMWTKLSEELTAFVTYRKEALRQKAEWLWRTNKAYFPKKGMLGLADGCQELPCLISVHLQYCSKAVLLIYLSACIWPF